MILLNSIISENNSTLIFVAIISLLGGLLGNYVSEKVKNSSSKEQLEISDRNAQKLQVDNFYRSISTEKVENIVQEWMDLLVSPEEMSKKDKTDINKMLKDIMVYGSAETIRLVSIFQQYSYQRKFEKADNSPYELLFISAYLLSSLKNDFTGYRIDPLDLLKMKIKDISDPAKQKVWNDSMDSAKEIIKKGL
ncbi:hypothetical protein [Enterococcus casseliflavus]|uniref:hypothetical protein n=1 Tax=Enterococcus casseliflavus TaxID=37734 RepID=UPI0039A5BED7